MIKTFTVEGLQCTSDIHVGASLSRVGDYLPDQGPVVIVTDENILKHYGASFPAGHVITIGTGEKIKTLATVEYILREMIKLGATGQAFYWPSAGALSVISPDLRHLFFSGASVSALFPPPFFPR